MRFSLLIAFVLVTPLAGCLGGSDGSTSGPDMAVSTGEQFNGGTILIPSCGYSITTPDQVTAPVLGTPVLGTDPTPGEIHLTLPSQDASTTMAVLWQTNDVDTLATTVQYGENGMTDQTVDGYTFEYQLGAEETKPLSRIHETHMCGLKPDTVYTYRVGGKDANGNEKWSATSTFHTAPATTSMSTITIGILGDSRGNYTTWGAMVQTLMTTGMPDVIFFSGDAVTLGTLQAEWDQYFTAAQPVFSKVPLVFAHGNHEANAYNYYAQVAFPGDEQNFGIDYGPVHLTVLNDTAIDPSVPTSYLPMDLTASDAAPWKFLMHHQPMYSSATAHGSNLTLRGEWLPFVDAHKVDMVLSGHDHDYERTKPLRGGNVQVNPYDGTTFMVGGGAGADLYTNGQSSWTDFSKETYNFSVIKITGKAFSLTAYDDMGTVIDTLSYSKP